MSTKTHNRYHCLKTLIATLFFVVLCIVPARSENNEPWNEAGWLPEKGNHFVYDYSKILSAGNIDTLETILRNFNDSTSNQIVVMIVPGFGGRDVSSFAFEVGNKWGIGQKGLNNGVIIVIKPKDENGGDVEIASGEGLEGVLPDIFCKRIIEDMMIPLFKEDKYYEAILASLDVILPVCAGEYSYEQYKEDHDDTAELIIGLALLGGLGYFALKRIWKWGGGRSDFGGGGGFVGGSHYGGGFSSGHSSSWSGSSFGGGSFGGGGASGHW